MERITFARNLIIIKRKNDIETERSLKVKIIIFDEKFLFNF